MNETRFMETLKTLIDIDSATGQYHEIEEYLIDELERMGYEPETLNKGGIICCLGGNGNPLCITAHADTLGLMVRHINEDGTIKVVKVGGLYAYNCEQENVRIHTRDKGIVTGTVRRKESSVHVTPDEKWDEVPDFEKNVIVMVDADVKNADDVRDLGIEVGDYINLDPRFTCQNGYIKSRFLDDKAMLAIMLEGARELKEKNVSLSRKVYIHIAMYEEIGHGGSFIPEDTRDFIAMDIACTGKEQTSSEKKVSVFCKDSRFPYHIDIIDEMIDCAKDKGLDYVCDIFTPHYGTDADPALAAGYDIRHGAFGPGITSSHGYERTHIDGIKNTYGLFMGLIQK
ncbi:MAG: M42 family metallopeptidase [Lachnospiraceae bacterium]|nr:M42 family metallopeptidase [Lachnospiraceae bacterium]